jgi:hypothetical protein
MALDVDALAKQMFVAAFDVVKAKAPSIGAYVGVECTKIAHTMATIESEAKANQISQDQAKILLDMQRSATRSVFLTAEGLGLLTTAAALNAAFDAVRSVVNTAVGFALV